MGIGFVAFSPLGRGFLTGTINAETQLTANDFRKSNPRFQPDSIKANQKLIDLLNNVAKMKNATPAQIALAWLVSHKPWITPIPGTTKLSRLEENLGAVNIDLTDLDLQEINEAASKIPIEGNRYPDALEKMSGI